MFKKNVNLAQLKTLALEIAKNLPPHVIILLRGNLGSGKTTFTKLLVEALGINMLVSSPSFIIMNQYAIKNLCVNHFDFYRLLDSSSVNKEIGEFSHYFNENINIIEWPILPAAYYQTFAGNIIEVGFNITNNYTREIKINRLTS